MLDIEKNILQKGTELFFNGGEFLYRRDQEADYVFYLKDGVVEIQDTDPINAYRIEGCRCFLGLHEIILDKKHEESVKIAEPSILVAFDKSLIHHLMNEQSAIRRYFMLKMCDHMAALSKSYE